MKSLSRFLVALAVLFSFAAPVAAQRVTPPYQNMSPGFRSGATQLGSRYLGAFATGVQVFNANSTGNKQGMSRSTHTAKASVTGPQIVIGNWNTNGANHAEQFYGSPTTWTASIEYPAGSGTCYPATFGGAASSSPNGGVTIISDPVMAGASPLAITTGTKFQVRLYQNGAGGISYVGLEDYTAEGEVYNFGPSGITDRTVTCDAIPSTSVVASQRPQAVVAMIDTPSVMIIGDSRAAGGASDVFSGGVTDVGEIARSVGASYGYINASTSGQRVEHFLASNTRQRALAQYASAVHVQLGVNDVTALRTLGQIQADLQAVWALFPGEPITQSTISPRTTSTDAWATLANQTAAAGFSTAGNGTREQLNDWIRTRPTGLTTYFEVADQVESSRNSGKWKVTGAANYATIDGTHESAAGYLLIPAANAIPAASFGRGVAGPSQCFGSPVGLDFANSVFCFNYTRYGSFTEVPGATYTRTGNATVPNSAGSYQTFAANVPPITDLGLWVEEGTTNSVRNSAAAGVVPGDFGGGGSPPTNWVGQSATGVVFTMLGSGVEFGLPYVEARISGTPAQTTSVGFAFEPSTVIAAAQGQTWTGSVGFRMSAGSTVNITQPIVSVYERDNTGAILTSSSTGFTPSVALQRVVHTRAFTQAATAYTSHKVELSVTNGLPVDITFRVYVPQEEQKPYATSPVITTGAAASRGAPTAAVTGLGSVLTAPFTSYVEWDQKAAMDGVDTRPLDLSDGTTSNRVTTQRGVGNLLAPFMVTGGVTQAGSGALVGYVGNRRARVASRVRSTVWRNSMDGGLTADSTAITAPVLDRLHIGTSSFGSAPVNAPVRQAVLRGDTTDAQLQAITQ